MSERAIPVFDIIIWFCREFYKEQYSFYRLELSLMVLEIIIKNLEKPPKNYVMLKINLDTTMNNIF